jgi:hypothetical protein
MYTFDVVLRDVCVVLCLLCALFGCCVIGAPEWAPMAQYPEVIRCSPPFVGQEYWTNEEALVVQKYVGPEHIYIYSVYIGSGRRGDGWGWWAVYSSVGFFVLGQCLWLLGQLGM